MELAECSLNIVDDRSNSEQIKYEGQRFSLRHNAKDNKWNLEFYVWVALGFKIKIDACLHP